MKKKFYIALIMLVMFTITIILSLSLGNIPLYGKVNFMESKDRSSKSVFPRKMEKVIRKDGWDIIKGMNLVPDDIKINEKLQNIDNLSVKVKYSEINPKQTCKLEDYVVLSEKELEVRQIDCKVYKIYSYEFNGSVFAYKVDFALIDEKSKRTLGAIISYYYIDNDGDKIFEELNTSEELTKVPDWVM